MTEDQIYGGRYHIEDPIGDGAMARVYRATDARLGRVVALKILREQFTNEPEFVERFRLEARLAAGLAHPNIVAVYDVGEDHGRYFIVMEYVPGQNLRQIIARDAPFPLEVVISYMRQLAAGLDYAHSHGVIHRDIKPENILVTGRRELKVGDFGIARALAGGNLTATGTVLGSVSYLSPEQASGQPASAESDLYSAGMVLYEMLTKHVPFAGPNPVAVAMAQVNDTPISPRTFVPELLPSTEAVVLKSISKNPADRFHSGYEMIAALTGQALSPELSQRHVAPAAAAVAAAPTMVASPQMLAAVPRQKPKRGGGGALAALLSTAALLIAAVLIGRSLTSGSASPPTATGTPSPTSAATSAPKPNATTKPVVVPNTTGPSTATAAVPSATSAPAATATGAATNTPAASSTPADTATAAHPATAATTPTPVVGHHTPTPTDSTATPDTGSSTSGSGKTHGTTISLVTAKGVGSDYSAVGATSSFPAKSSAIYAVAALHKKHKGDLVAFTWRYPDGSHFTYKVSAVTANSGDIPAYAELTPSGPGNYTVTASINGHELASASFTVVAGSHAASPTDTPTGQ